MAALVGALVVAAGFLLLAIAVFQFRRPDPHPLTLQDDFGSYVAVSLVALVTIGLSRLIENWPSAPPAHIGIGLAAIAASLVSLLLAVLRARAANRAAKPAGKGG